MAWRDILDMIFSVIKTAEPVDILDILVLSYVVYVVMKLVRETRAGQLVKGIMLLFLVYIVASWIKMKAISYLMSETLNIGMIALVILFQPELRRTLEKAGYTKLGLRFSMNAGADDGIWSNAIDVICDSCVELSATSTGALIVIEQRIGLKDIIETGTSLNSQISAALLENIFEPNTPLHDGAVVIRGPRIMAAACILSLSDGKGISRELGTRHRAARGVTETTDAISLIVSEETGTISVARNGRLTRHLDRAALENLLLSIYHQKETGLWSTLMEKTKRRKGGAE